MRRNTIREALTVEGSVIVKEMQMGTGTANSCAMQAREIWPRLNDVVARFDVVV